MKRRFLGLGLVVLGACVEGAWNLDWNADRKVVGVENGAYGHRTTTVYANKTRMLAVSAPTADTVFIYKGLATKPAAPGGFGGQTTKFTGKTGGEAGWGLATGRLVGSASDDLIIGAPSENNGKGAVYVIDGDRVGGGDLGVADASVVLKGTLNAEYAGWSVAAGDFDDDGKEDLAVGACGAQGFVGRVYIAFGPLAASIDLDDTHVITGDAVDFPGDIGRPGLGCEVYAGDLDLDGDDELILPTTYGSEDEAGLGGAGKVHVVYTLPEGDADIRDVEDQVIYTSTRQWEGMGHAVGIGDVNGDVAPDLVFGASHYFCNVEAARTGDDPCDDLLDREGRVYVVLSAHEDHDPGDNVWKNVEARADVIVSGDEQDFGRSIDVGDVDHDGNDDVLIGEPRASTAYLFYGDAVAGTAGFTDLDALDAYATFKTATRGGASSVELADFDADKKSDVVTVAMGQSWVYGASVGAGRTHVVFGNH